MFQRIDLQHRGMVQSQQNRSSKTQPTQIKQESQSVHPPEGAPSMMDNVMRSHNSECAPTTPPQAFLQAKLTIGQIGDRYEQEADRVAKQVVQRLHAPTISATDPPHDEISVQCKAETFQKIWQPMLQKKEVEKQTTTEQFDRSLSRARSGGQSLAPNLQRSMGEAMGADFSGVRIHTDTTANELNQSIQAKAFTTGRDVFFKRGAYQPGSKGGQELIAHELTHVVQQGATVQRKEESGERRDAIEISESQDDMTLQRREHITKNKLNVVGETHKESKPRRELEKECIQHITKTRKIDYYEENQLAITINSDNKENDSTYQLLPPEEAHNMKKNTNGFYGDPLSLLIPEYIAVLALGMSYMEKDLPNLLRNYHKGQESSNPKEKEKSRDIFSKGIETWYGKLLKYWNSVRGALKILDRITLDELSLVSKRKNSQFGNDLDEYKNKIQRLIQSIIVGKVGKDVIVPLSNLRNDLRTFFEETPNFQEDKIQEIVQSIQRRKKTCERTVETMMKLMGIDLQSLELPKSHKNEKFDNSNNDIENSKNNMRKIALRRSEIMAHRANQVANTINNQTVVWKIGNEHISDMIHEIEAQRKFIVVSKDDFNKDFQQWQKHKLRELSRESVEDTLDIEEMENIINGLIKNGGLNLT